METDGSQRSLADGYRRAVKPAGTPPVGSVFYF
jgi:hypothetical protein